MLVLVGHAQSSVAHMAAARGDIFVRWQPIPWGASVDLFFVISGIIMVHASRRSFARPGAWREFLHRRLTRIVPLYWIATTVYLALLVAAAWKGGTPPPALGWVAASYLFLPWSAPEGGLFPVFDLGWTLQYEMLFYLLFAGVLFLPRRRAVAAVLLALLALVTVGAAAPDNAQFLFWTRPIVVEFGLGAIVGAMVAEGVVLRAPLRIALVAGSLAVLASDPLHVFVVPLGATVDNGWPRVAMAGLPAATLLAGALLAPPSTPRSWLRPALAVGDASYALYLFHPFALIILEKLVQKIAAVAALPHSVLVAAAVLLGIAIAFAIHLGLERRLSGGFRRSVAS